MDLKRIAMVVVFIFLLITSMAAAAGTGTLKGEIQWKYSKFELHKGPDGRSSGTVNVNSWDKKYAQPRGDSGAKIALIPAGFNKNSISEAQERDWYMTGQSPEGSNLFMTQTNNEGYYEIKDIPDGEYTAVIISRKVKEHVAYADSVMAQYIRNWDFFSTVVLSDGQYVCKKIQIHDGETMVINYLFDFTPHRGYSANYNS